MTTQPTRRFDNGELNARPVGTPLTRKEREEVVVAIDRADAISEAQQRNAKFFGDWAEDTLLDTILTQCEITRRHQERWEAGDIEEGIWCALEGALSDTWHK